ncbi:MAG: ATP-binding cassette domain-containing protein [candidate division Zixibacteria bacterium]|nr:ATP-binding cassette domain-containing protein [candidate division Zixibacteria bacterium]
MSDPVLVVDRITKRFGHLTAVNELSLSVPRGSVYGMIGPNGAGKTTTIRMILDIIGPDSGTVTLNVATGGDRSDRIGYMPEERGLYRKMTVEQNLLFFASLKSVPNAEAHPRIDRWLKRLDLSDWKKRPVEELSKGMQQKVQFLTTILHEPELLVLDELFSGLDPVNTEIMKDLLLEMRLHGTTVLFSTHVMEQAEKVCDAICMIDHGNKVLDATLDDIRSEFGRNALLVEGDLPAASLKTLPGVESVRSDRRRFELTLGSTADVHELMSTIVGLGYVERMERQRPSLHHIFLEVAGYKGDTLAQAEAGDDT